VGSELDLVRSRRLLVPELVARSARRDPEAPALAFEDETRSYRELDQRANRVAHPLAARGVGPGENVAIQMHNCIEFVEAFLGIQKLGACAVPVNFRLSAEEVEYVLADSKAVASISEEELAGAPYEEALAAPSPGALEVVVDDEQLAFLMYTSGTTGRPKGAMLSHQNLVVNTTNWLYEVGARPGDVWLSGLPLFHIGGLNGLLREAGGDRRGIRRRLVPQRRPRPCRRGRLHLCGRPAQGHADLRRRERLPGGGRADAGRAPGRRRGRRRRRRPPALGGNAARRRRPRAGERGRRGRAARALSRKAGRYKKPAAVVFADALPRNAAGKVLKRQLREEHGAMFASE
jgi:acyl-CoA synthetase (AMP-forming)/AMP-acid ligase II